jgi:mono/diheme cytochrome c family protein
VSGTIPGIATWKRSLDTMQNGKTLVGLALAAAVLTGGLVAAMYYDRAKEPARAGTVSLADGAALYAAQCASCHGANLKGQANWRQRGPDGLLPAPPHDASGHTWHHPDQQLFAITKYGTEALIGGDYKSSMRGFADDLSDDQIWAVLRYIQSQWPVEIRRQQQDITARAQ